LFVNLKPPTSSEATSVRKYANVFRRLSLAADGSPDHLTMTWFGSPGQTRTSASITRLLARAEAAADTEAAPEAGQAVVNEGGVLLYARYPGGSYVLLSRVRPYTVSDADDGAVTITWLLLDSHLLLQRMPKLASLICEQEEQERGL
jgi:hypothetical protein